MRTPRGTGSRTPGHSRSRGAHAQTTIPALGLDRPSSDQLKVGRISLTAVFHPNPKKQVWRRQTVDASSAGLFTLIIVSVRALSVTAPGTARSVIAPGPTDPTAYTRARATCSSDRGGAPRAPALSRGHIPGISRQDTCARRLRHTAARGLCLA